MLCRNILNNLAEQLFQTRLTDDFGKKRRANVPELPQFGPASANSGGSTSVRVLDGSDTNMKRLVLAALAAALLVLEAQAAGACGVTDFASCLPRQPNPALSADGGPVQAETPSAEADVENAQPAAIRREGRRLRQAARRYRPSARAARAKIREAAALQRQVERKAARETAKATAKETVLREKTAAREPLASSIESADADPMATLRAQGLKALQAAAEARAGVVDPAEINELDRLADENARAATPTRVAMSQPETLAAPTATDPGPIDNSGAVATIPPPATKAATASPDGASPLGKIFLAIGGVLAAGTALRMFLG